MRTVNGQPARRSPVKLRHGAAVILGMFVLGVIPLLVSASEADRLDVHKTSAAVSLSDATSEGSPLKTDPATSEWSSAESLDCPSTDMRLLVVAADGNESTLPAIRETLDYLGTPYTVYLAANNPGGLTPDKLSDGCRGFYQGVILATGNLAYNPNGGADARSALTDAEWEALRGYEEEFDVRRAAWYAYPSPDYGLESPERVNTAKEPLEAQFTEAGKDVFSYVNAQNPLTIRDAFAYPAEPTDESTTPLLTDGEGDTLAAVSKHPGGRETLALTFDSAPRLLHSTVLSYGLVNWVTKGLFLGERRVYLSAQVDDFLIPNELAAGGTYRVTGDDLRAVLDWQDGIREQPATRRFRLDMAYNAYGATGLYAPDMLTPAARENQDEFKWINHTYQHLDLDELDYSAVLPEVQENNEWARQTRLDSYDPVNLVTPEYSGLRNPQMMQAAYDSGVRYMVGDDSKPAYDNPSPNAGRYHPLQPEILLIPRHAVNLFFDVSTPEQWVAEYNQRYEDFWGRSLTYEEVLDRESDILLSYLLEGDMDPLMFHQANLRAYDGGHTLLGDLLDRTLEKYNRFYKLPVRSPAMEDLGRRMEERMRYNQAEVKASASEEEIRLTAQRDVRVPVTGLRSQDAESYGGQPTSYLSLNAGETVTISLE